MEAGKEDFNKEAFFNRDDVKNATDKDIVIDLESIMSKEIKIADSLTFTIRTIIEQIWSVSKVRSSPLKNAPNKNIGITIMKKVGR